MSPSCIACEMISAMLWNLTCFEVSKQLNGIVFFLLVGKDFTIISVMTVVREKSRLVPLNPTQDGARGAKSPLYHIFHCNFYIRMT